MSSSKPTVTVRDIAERLGLSAATVSAALTGRRNRIFVSDDTRQRVLDAASAMAYPLERLRARHHRLQRIAVVSPIGPNTVYHTTTLELCHVLSEQGYGVLIHASGDYTQVVEAARRLYRHHEADGLILIGSAEYYQGPELSAIPCVVVGEVPEGCGVWQVVVDNEQGGRLVGQHLWGLGHRRVGFVFCEYNPLPAQRRLAGLRRAWAAAGSDLGDDCVLCTRTDSPEELAERLPSFIRRSDSGGDPLSALFCWNDWTALGALRVLRGMGLRVPGDISVVGFDNAPLAEMSEPPLTTVNVPFADLGTTAAQLLEERLNAIDQPPAVRVLGCELVPRASTARALSLSGP